jgi:hypothetical protein
METEFEGVTYDVEWTKIPRNHSVFIPCLNCEAVREKVTKIVTRLELPTAMKIAVEDGIRGLRVWRL